MLPLGLDQNPGSRTGEGYPDAAPLKDVSNAKNDFHYTGTITYTFKLIQ